MFLEKLIESKEIKEGFLICKNCHAKYPIICSIPILWDDFTLYLTSRTSLGGELFHACTSSKLKKFVKKSLSKVTRKADDRTGIEKNWSRIYQNSIYSSFYTKIKPIIKKLPKSRLALEHGCSIGTASKFLSNTHELVFGIDSSFPSIIIANKSKPKNVDFFVADSLNHPFGTLKFDCVVGLNLLEIIEPIEFLKVVSKQISKGHVLISDPYDFERGIKSIKKPLYEKELRKHLEKLGFVIDKNTKKPSYVNWKLKINLRANLNYKVDIVLAKK